MNKLPALLALCVFSPCAVYSQSAYQVLRAAPKATWAVRPATVSRQLKAPLSSARLAQQVARLPHPYYTHISLGAQQRNTKRGPVTIPQIYITTSFPVPLLEDPSALWGNYHYLRAIASFARKNGAVHPDHAGKWRHIWATDGYNGAHHIVNQSALKVIYEEMKRQAAAQNRPFTVNLEDMQRNAPGALHPFHGKPEHSAVFHNLEKQLALYNQGGVKAVVTHYFQEMRGFHTKYPDAPPIPEETVRNTLLEAKLWSETFQLKWE